MKIVKNRTEWRSETIRHLVENGSSALDAIDGAKAIESYLFDSENELIIRIKSNEQREALKNFIESFG